MVTGEDREVIERLAKDCLRLDDHAVTSAIFQGLITSADYIYHLRKIGDNTYECSPPKRESYVVDVEDTTMKPLVSGQEAKRYESPETNTYLLFPYERDQRNNLRLVPPDTLNGQFPLAWAYLVSNENELRARENTSFDDDAWYRFGRNQNLDKQDLPKLIVAQTVPEMRVSADYEGNRYLNNVRVNGILPAPGCDMSFLMAALNGPVAGFVFRRIAKPKQGGWFEANKQFIAPLPIPQADAKTQKSVGIRAKELQKRWTRRRDLLNDAAARLSVLGRSRHGAKWLWPDLPDLDTLKTEAPKRLNRTEKTDWAHAQFDEMVESRIEALQGVLNAGGQLSAKFGDGELRLFSGGAVVLDKIFLDDTEGKLVLAYWQFLSLSKQQGDAKSFAASLRRPPAGAETPAARQFIEKTTALLAETTAIRALEVEMNETLYKLYHLSPNERNVIERDCAQRPVL